MKSNTEKNRKTERFVFQAYTLLAVEAVMKDKFHNNIEKQVFFLLFPWYGGQNYIIIKKLNNLLKKIFFFSKCSFIKPTIVRIRNENKIRSNILTKHFALLEFSFYK